MVGYKGCVQRFLLNELETSEERDAALAVFAAAVIEDRQSSSDVGKSGEGEGGGWE